MGDKLVAVLTGDELAALLATCKGGGFQSRRDYAVISLFKDAGVRLSELARLAVADVSPANREAVVTGKGDRQRTVRFTDDTSRALDRYLRERARRAPHRARGLPSRSRRRQQASPGIPDMHREFVSRGRLHRNPGPVGLRACA